MNKGAQAAQPLIGVSTVQETGSIRRFPGDATRRRREEVWPTWPVFPIARKYGAYHHSAPLGDPHIMCKCSHPLRGKHGAISRVSAPPQSALDSRYEIGPGVELVGSEYGRPGTKATRQERFVNDFGGRGFSRGRVEVTRTCQIHSIPSVRIHGAICAIRIPR
jgi:hypothetical protein